jgi:carbon-monoxide dehydrogenase large subunit
MAFTTLVGARVRRREDPRLITGRATYTDDVKAVGTLYAAIVRSVYAHAKIAVDVSAAKTQPGVVAAYSGRDIVAAGLTAGLPYAPGHAAKLPVHHPLAVDVARFAGEAIAVVVADSPYRARDAAESVEVHYEELPVVVDALKAAAGPPYVFPEFETNVAFVMPLKAGDPDAAFRDADVIIKERIVNQRVAPMPLEPRTVFAQWDVGPQQLTFYSSTQIPHLLRTQLARTLALDESRVRVIAPEVGGGFGAKADVYAEEVLCAWLAMTRERPVKFIETRSESFESMIHGRDQVDDLEIACRNDGTITGLRVRITANLGAYLQWITAIVPTLTVLMSTGCYDLKNLDIECTAVFTNTMSTDAYRGAGRPEATFYTERMVDLVAHRLGLDPAEVRRKNFVRKDQFPYATATGLLYDSGDYEGTMDKALHLADYAGWRAKQAEARKHGRYLGIGLSTYVEICGMGPSKALPGGGWDSSTVRVEPTGAVTVLTGISPHGQGEETSFAQIVADQLGVPIEKINVIHGDTDKVQYGLGTYGSRGLAVGGSALVLALETVRDKAVKIAAHTWEANPDDVEFRDGVIGVKGDPAKEMAIAEVAAIAWAGANIPAGMEPGLDATRRFDPPNFVFPFGTHVCVVEVDARSGAVEILKFVAVDDCGNVINPLLVEGQVHGGIAQGLAQALFEEVVYDEHGRLLTGSLMDYAVPRAENMPHLELSHTVTPTDVNPLGVKGVGEAGTIGATPAIAAAVIDALAPFGVAHLDMPLRPEKLWAVMQRGPATNGSAA